MEPKGPKIEKANLLKISQSHLKILKSRLKMFSILTLSMPHHKEGVWWVARLKFSISLENFNPGIQDRDLEIVQSLGL